MIRVLSSPSLLGRMEYQYQLDVDIKKANQRSLFQSDEKIIHEVRWINQNGPAIVLLQINGPTAEQEALFYTRFNNHSNIIKTFGRVRNNSDLVMLLQERSPKADLSEMLRANGFKPTEKVLCTIFEQICDAMIFLSNNDIVHGDLACRNVLVFQSDPTEPEKNLVKLTDFGLARDLRNNKLVNTSSIIIPVRYAAPEILRNSNRLEYSQKSDIYSMGILMWEACSYGEIPYTLIEKDEDVRHQKLNDRRLSRPSLCSDQLWAIINECWHPNPKQRLTFQTLKQQLSNFDTQSILKSNQPPIINKSFQSPYIPLPQISRNSSMIVLSHDNSRSSSRSLVTPTQPPYNQLPPLSRRTSDDRSVVVTNDETESEHEVSIFEQEHRIERRSKSWNVSNQRTRPIPCQFCQEVFPSTIALREHLVLCGNKTQRCSNCHRFIRRAIFMYHTDNNCVNPDETNTASSGTTVRLPSLPSMYEDFSNNSTKPNVRSQTPVSNSRISPITVECKYCHKSIIQNDYEIHKENCRENLVYVNRNKERSRPLRLNRNEGRSLIDEHNISYTLVYIPCEICGKTIVKSDYSAHTKDCLQQNRHRNEKRAQRMSRQRTTGSIPCEFCEKLYSPNQLHSHQMCCPENPRNDTTPVGTPIQRQYSPSPTTSSLSQSSMFNPTYATRLSNSVDRDNNNRLYRRVIPREARKRQVTTHTPSLESRNASRSSFIYERTTELRQKHRSLDKQNTISRSNSVLTLDTQQKRFRSVSPRSQLTSNSFQNSTDSNLLNRLRKSTVNVNNSEFRTKNTRTRSRQRRLKHIRKRNKKRHRRIKPI